jgi:hypothetical protein
MPGRQVGVRGRCGEWRHEAGDRKQIGRVASWIVVPPATLTSRARRPGIQGRTDTLQRLPPGFSSLWLLKPPNDVASWATLAQAVGDSRGAMARLMAAMVVGNHAFPKL